MKDVLVAQNRVGILCVDDEWIVRAGLNYLLTQQPGYEITGVDSVEDAIGALTSGEVYDLIILDLKMPDSQPFAGDGRRGV